MPVLSKIKIILDRTEPSNRLHVLALDRETHCYLSAKISSPEEIIDRNIDRSYKDILNPYMLFRIDFRDAFNAAKSIEQFRKNSEPFKDTSLLWKISPKEVTREYEQVFTNYKNLKPKKLNFIDCHPQKNKNKNKEFENSPVVIMNQDNTNDLISQQNVIQHFPSENINLNSLPKNNTENLIQVCVLCCLT
jgi:hypothetical protein